MTEDEIKNWMRIYAVEILAVNQLAYLCLTVAPAAPQKLAAEIRQQLIETARKHGFPDFDPAMSDLLSAELEVALDRLMEMVDGQITAVIDSRRSKAK